MFSIIMPIDSNRLEQFRVTKKLYDKMPQKKEFVMPTRSYDEVHAYFKKHKMLKDVRLIPYVHEVGFNPSKPNNIGVREAKYDHLIFSSPEVKPLTNVLEQFETLLGQNVVAQVFDEDENGKVVMSLVHNGFRSDTPAAYFLAMFNKADVEKINGWDEDFMAGYAYEDTDFGARWVRAGIPFVVNEQIKGQHQYHPRSETVPGGLSINLTKYNDNNNRGIVRCENGLYSG